MKIFKLIMKIFKLISIILFIFSFVSLIVFYFAQMNDPGYDLLVMFIFVPLNVVTLTMVLVSDALSNK